MNTDNKAVPVASADVAVKTPVVAQDESKAKGKAEAKGKGKAKASKAEAKASKAEAKVKTITVFSTATGKEGRYQNPMKGNHSLQSGMTIAALVAIGAIKMSGKGLITSTGKAIHRGLFKTLAGGAAGYVTSRVADSKGVIGASGINFLQARVSGKAKAFNTTPEIINNLLPLIQKGGEKKVNGFFVRFPYKTTIMDK